MTGTSLPALGRRGGGWVVLQICLIVAVIAAGLAGPPWPAAAHLWLSVAAALLGIGGIVLAVGGGFNLGRQLTPFPHPVEEGALRRDGAYRVVRHPMYGGVLLLVLAWALVSSPLALVVWALSVVFLDAKRRREEAWLLARHADYADYQRQVRSRLIPFVW